MVKLTYLATVTQISTAVFSTRASG